MKFWIAAAVSAILLTTASTFTVDEALRNMAPDKAGILAAHDLISVVKNVYNNRQSNAQTKEYFAFLAKSFRDFDFNEIYNSHFLKKGASGYKGLSFQGINKPGVFDFGLAPAHRSKENLQNMGSFTADVAMKRNHRSVVGDPSFSTYINTTINTGQLSHQNLLAFAEGLLQVISPDNVKKIQDLNCRNSRVACSQPFEAVDEFNKAFPESSRFLSQYFLFRSTSTIEEFQGKEINRFVLTGTTMMKKLHKDYPWIASFFSHLEGTVKFRALTTNESGHILSDIEFDSKDKFFTLTICTRDGKIIPYDGFGKPVFKEEYYLTELDQFPFDITVDLYNHANGLLFTTKGIRILADYESSKDRMLFILRSDNLVDTEVSGRALYILPTWTVDMLLPTSMEELIYDFSTVMIQANGGEGTVFKIVLDTRNPNDNKMHVFASTEFIDNFFIRFGARMASDYMGMGKITQKQAKAMATKTLDLILADLKP